MGARSVWQPSSCLLSKPPGSVFLGEGNAHIVGSGDRGYEPAQGPGSQVETNNKMKVS